MERLGGMADHWIFRYLNSSDRQMIMANVDLPEFAAGETRPFRHR